MLKPFLVFLVFVVIAIALLSLLMPTKQKLERSVTINAPASLVYEQLSRLENFNTWSVWSRSDSSAKYTISGTDGSVGSSSSWTGDPRLSGDGKLQIVALEPGRKVAHSLQLVKPKKIDGNSVFTLSENNGNTTVTWNFDVATPRPWNIFNLFYSMDKTMGRDFETSLAALKNIVETKNGSAPAEVFAVKEMNFPATRFAIIRQEIKWADISNFFAQHLPILFEETGKNNVTAGTPSGLYYLWDEKNQQADLATAVPIPAGANLSHNIIRTEDINASKAIYVDYKGAYDRVADAHTSLDKYMAANKLQKKIPVIEQYIYGPSNEKDTTKWITKIVYLVE